jgi:hypothetical protein
MKCYEENGNANAFYLNCIFKTPFLPMCTRIDAGQKKYLASVRRNEFDLR